MKLSNILQELRKFNRKDKDAILLEYISIRLDESAKTYYEELQRIEKHLLVSLKSNESLKGVVR